MAGSATHGGAGPPHRRLASGVVRRAALHRRLVAATDTRVVSVIAPGGYGKTTVLAQWDREDERPFVWLEIERRHNDPIVLLADLADRLAGIEAWPAAFSAALAPLVADMSTDVLPRLGRAVSARQTPFVLVVDDAERLGHPVAVEVLEVIADALPPGSQLVVAGRPPAPLRLARRRANRQLLELGTADLAMDHAEAAALLALEGIDVPVEAVSRLLAHTEGWPAGLYLAVLATRGAEDPQRVLDALRGTDPGVAAYFRDELLQGLPDALVQFLTRTSVLDELSGPLCDAVLRSQNSAACLDDVVARSNLFVFALDRGQGRYRYHALFAQLLRYELQVREPGLDVVLHGRASDWYAAHGDVDRAVDHAALAGDPARGGDLIFDHLLEYATAGRNATIGVWLEPFSPAAVRATPTLALASAWYHMGAGEPTVVQRWIDVAEDGLSRLPASPRSVALADSSAITRALLGADGVPAMLALAASVRARGADASAWWSLAFYLEAAGHVFMGDHERGRELLIEAERATVRHVGVHAPVVAQLARLHAEDGDWATARYEAERARNEIIVSNLRDYVPIAPVFGISAVVLAHVGEREQATRDARQVRRLLGRFGPLSPRGAIFSSLLLAEAELALGDLVAAQTMLVEAERLLPHEPDALGLHRQAQKLRAGLQQGPPGEGPSSLTPAETRVLEFLPTHLTMAEIADRLFVSRSTVKTHTQAVYRKLAAGNRGDAVRRARRLGMLEP
jgi:LuxR family maltose regulon positive regulatory protein